MNASADPAPTPTTHPSGTDRVPLWRRAGVWVLLIVALGAVLRLWKLDSPGIWGDEAATYGRVNGSYNELLDVLQFDGFMPLHYQLYWLLARGLVLDPWWLRLWPAVTGILTVPAIYFLARQLLSRPSAVVTTLLAATSAYLLYYSRDAKMYAPLWLFTTLSMGCFLAWLRQPTTTQRRSGLPFWGWIAASVAAVGIHAPALLAVAVQPLIFPAMPGRSWKRLIGLALGLALTSAGPVVHYGYFNRWYDRIREEGWNASMLQWVQWYNQGRDLPELLRFTSTAYATAWEWPDKPRDRLMVDPTWLTRWEWACVAIGLVVLAGVIPWRRIWGWLQLARRRPQPEGLPPPDTVSWLTVWVLAVWAIVPAYGIYVISFAKPAPPWALPGYLASHPWALLITGILLIGTVLSMRSWRCAVKGVSILAVITGLCCLVHFGILLDRTHHIDWLTLSATPRDTAKPVKMLWMPRYLGVAFPAVLIAGTALLMRLPVGLREVAIAGLVAVNLGNFGFKIWYNPEPPIARIIGELWDDRRAADAGQPTRITFTQATLGHGFEPGAGSISGVVGRYHYSLQLPEPLAPPEFRTGWGVVERGLMLRSNLRPRDVRAELQRGGTDVQTVVLWEHLNPRATPPRDPLGQALGPGWALGRVDTWDTYDHWMWRRLAIIRRSEYTRAVPVASGP